ncbi:MAG: efflux RND transporter periplasmic adaptor subunit [Janthinobacterium lividum]
MRKSSILVVVVAGLGLALYFALQSPRSDKTVGQDALHVRVITLTLQDVPRMLGGLGTVHSLHGATGTTPVAAEFALPENTLPVLQNLIQDTENPPVLAYANSQSPSLLAEGRLTLIDNEAPSATVRVKAEFENARQTLHAGEAINLQVQTGWLRQVLAVPADVVRHDGGQDAVYRLEGDTVASVPVKVTYRTVMLEVIEGVQQGDQLVVDGPTALKPGTRVQVVAQ